MQKRKINSEILDNSYKLRQSSSIIKLYDELHKKILENLIFIEDHEPLKIFRHTHQKWVESKKTLSNLDNK